MPRVSVRTLTLMLLLLVAVISHQYIQVVPAAHAEVVWLAGDDPNEPIESEPLVGDAGLGLFLLDDDPNEPIEAVPAMTGWALGLCGAEDDPNEPIEVAPGIV